MRSTTMLKTHIRHRRRLPGNHHHHLGIPRPLRDIPRPRVDYSPFHHDLEIKVMAMSRPIYQRTH